MTIYEKYTKKKLNITDSYENDYDTIGELWRIHMGGEKGHDKPNAITTKAEVPSSNQTKPKFKGDLVNDRTSWYKTGHKYWDV